MAEYNSNVVPEETGSRYIAGQVDNKTRPRIYIIGDPTALVGIVDGLERARIVPVRVTNIIRALGVHNND